MVVTECYGKNIYLGDQLVGYISRLPDGDSVWYIAGRKAARMTADGKIVIAGKEVGYIDDFGDIYIQGKRRGQISPGNDLMLKSL